MKRGFTLIELLVYMAIMGFIVVVAGRAYSDSTSMRIRSQNMLRSSEEAGRVSAILKEDISQMGAKVWMASSSSGNGIFDYAPEVYYTDPNASDADLSSYELNEERNNLRFRKVHYSPSGTYQAVMEITWKVEEGVLKRSCRIINPAPSAQIPSECSISSSPEPVEVAKDITMFEFLPSKPGPENPSSPGTFADEIIFPIPPETFNFAVNNINSSAYRSKTGSKVVISGFSLNVENSSTTRVTEAYLAEAAGNNCKTFSFKAGEEYAIDFDLPYEPDPNDDKKINRIIMFQPGYDHLSIGLRRGSFNPGEHGEIINGVPDFLFYPSQSTNEFNQESKGRHFVFSVPEDVSNACIAITAAFYGQIAIQGFLTFENFKVSRKLDKVFHFDRSEPYYNPPHHPSSVAAKASVKAFELKLGVKKRDEEVQNITVIPVPNNGIVPTVGGTI